MADLIAYGRLLFRWMGLAAVAAGLAAGATPAAAQIGSERYSSIVVDATTGTVLSAVSPDEYRFPASLTKMMTLYMVFEAVRDRRVGLQDYVPISPSAAAMSPTKLGLVPGSLITVEQAVLALVTKSANDAAAALGEMLGGDEERFAQMMTLRARALSMTRTTFQNASGLPDWNQVTTARDMAVLARRLLQDFPQFYHYFSTPAFAYGGRYIRSHQALLATYAGADGLKTGYTDASGFNVVTSAARSNTRLIGVVLGAASSGERNAHMANLLDQGFDRMGVAPVFAARREPAYQLPALIGSARAASVAVAAPVARMPRQAPDRPAVALRAKPGPAKAAEASRGPAVRGGIKAQVRAQPRGRSGAQAEKDKASAAVRPVRSAPAKLLGPGKPQTLPQQRKDKRIPG